MSRTQIYCLNYWSTRHIGVEQGVSETASGHRTGKNWGLGHLRCWKGRPKVCAEVWGWVFLRLKRQRQCL